MQIFVAYIVGVVMGFLMGISVSAAEKVPEPEYRVVQTDRIGVPQPHKQSWTIKDGTLYPTDPVGNIQYWKGGVKAARKETK